MTTHVDQAAGRARLRPRHGRPPVAPERPKRRDPLWAKICLILGSIIMVASGATVVLPRLIAEWAASDIERADLVPAELGAPIDGSINLLMLGMDERSPSPTKLILTDTMIIAHIPATHDKVYLISMPRDAYVTLPPFPETNFPGGKDKLNAAFAYGARDGSGKPDNSTKGRTLGANLAMQTINELVPGGLRFSGAAIINFVGFMDVLKAIGGVHMCVDEETRSIHFDNQGRYHTTEVEWSQRRIYRVGCRHFNPSEALDFARQRHEVVGGDYARQRHQQQLLMAIFKKLMSAGTLTNLGKVTELQKAAKGLLTLDLGQTEIADWIYTLKNIRSDDIIMVKTNGGKITPGPVKNSETFSDTSMEMLTALHDDKMFEFLQQHTDWIAPEK